MKQRITNVWTKNKSWYQGEAKSQNCNYSNKSKVIAERHWKMRNSTEIHDPNSTVTPVTMQAKQEKEQLLRIKV